MSDNSISQISRISIRVFGDFTIIIYSTCIIFTYCEPVEHVRDDVDFIEYERRYLFDDFTYGHVCHGLEVGAR